MLIYNTWWMGVGKISAADRSGIQRELCYLRIGNSGDALHSDPHKEPTPVFRARLLQQICSHTCTLCHALHEQCHINIPLTSSALLTLSCSQNQRLRYTAHHCSHWHEQRWGQAPALRFIHLSSSDFSGSGSKNATDFLIFINRNLNPAECNVLLHVYFDV